MTAMRRIMPSPLKPITEMGALMPIENEAIRDAKRWTGGTRVEAAAPYAGPPVTGEGMRPGRQGPIGRRATVIAGNTRRTSLLGN